MSYLFGDSVIFKSGHYKVNIELQNLRLKQREIETAEAEWLGLPEEQDFPYMEAFIKTWATIGVISAGKSEFSFKYVGTKLHQEWGDLYDEDLEDWYSLDEKSNRTDPNVICGIVQDLYAVEEAVKSTSNRVFYFLIDDSLDLFDSRESNVEGRIPLTKFYWKIRHIIENAANRGIIGYINIVVQDFLALEVRLRQACGLMFFKNYDRVLETFNGLEPAIEEVLKEMKYKITVALDNKYRQFAICIDCADKYTFYNTDLTDYPKVKFIAFDGIDILDKHKAEMVNFLLDNYSVLDVPNYFLEGQLFKYKKQKKDEKQACIVRKSNFKEIITLAKTEAYELKQLNESIELENIDNKWNILDLIYYKLVKQLTYQEIARDYGIPSGTAHRHYSKFIKEQEEKDEQCKSKKIREILENPQITIQQAVFKILETEIGVRKLAESSETELREYVRKFVPVHFQFSDVIEMATIIKKNFRSS